MNQTEPVAQSSLQLIFSKCNYWFINQFDDWEHSPADSISYFQKDETQKAARSLFWRNLSGKIFQFDNFTYDGIASIEFEKKISKFKINFNPLIFYQYVVYSAAAELGIVMPKYADTEFDKLIPFLESRKDALKKYAWDLDFYLKLKEHGWNDEECWKNWNNVIHKNTYLFECLIYIFIHEMMHLMWSHNKRMLDTDEPHLFNKAADLAINQTLPIPFPLKRRLISQFSTFFWPEAQYAFLKYFVRTKCVSVPRKIKDILTNPETFLKNKDKFEIDDLINFNDNAHIRGKNADFYYSILKDSHGKEVIPPSMMMPWAGDDGEDGTVMFPHTPPGEGGDGDGDNEGEPKDGEGKDGNGRGEDGESDEGKEGDGTGEGGGEGEEDVEDESASGAFDRQIEYIEAGKMFRESFDKSEDKGKIDKENGGGRSEIPFSIALQERIEEYVKTKKNNQWKKQFRKVLLHQVNEKEKDITMTRSNRKRPDIFPGLKREVGLDVVFIIDTSGSIRKIDYQMFIGEIENVGKLCDLSNCRIIQCHTTVSSDDKKFSLKKIKKIVFKEKGGTRMRSALDVLVEEKNRRPVIIFTDGIIDYFTAEEFKFEIVLFVTEKNTAEDIKKRGFNVICPKED